jgi:hypothetical protein
MQSRENCRYDLACRGIIEPGPFDPLNRKKVPETPPRLNEVVRLVAMLGGFLARKGDGEPGVKTLWLGLQRVVDFAAGIRFAREAHAL